MADMDVNFSNVTDIRIPERQVKYIVGTNQNSSEGDTPKQLLLWRRPNEFPYVIGAYTYTNSAGNTVEFFSSYYIEKFEEPVPVKATYLPTYNGVINTSTYLMATSALVGTTLRGYVCSNENMCQNLQTPQGRGYISLHPYDPSTVQIFYTLDNSTKKILVYASKGENTITVLTPYPQHLEGVPTFLRYQYNSPIYLGGGFYMPYGEVNTPELCRVLDATTPIITLKRIDNVRTNISAVREDYSDYIAKYDEVTSGAYPKSEYPYLVGVTELGLRRVSNGKLLATNHYDPTFAFYVFFRVAR